MKLGKKFHHVPWWKYITTPWNHLVKWAIQHKSAALKQVILSPNPISSLWQWVKSSCIQNPRYGFCKWRYFPKFSLLSNNLPIRTSQTVKDYEPSSSKLLCYCRLPAFGTVHTFWKPESRILQGVPTLLISTPSHFSPLILITLLSLLKSSHSNTILQQTFTTIPSTVTVIKPKWCLKEWYLDLLFTNFLLFSFAGNTLLKITEKNLK